MQVDVEIGEEIGEEIEEEIEAEIVVEIEEVIDEELCKVDEVQKDLNYLLAGLHFLGAIPRKL